MAPMNWARTAWKPVGQRYFSSRRLASISPAGNALTFGFALVLALAVALGLGGFMADLEVVGVGQGGSCFRGMRV